MEKTKGFQIVYLSNFLFIFSYFMFNFLNEENTCPCFLIQIYENVCLDNILVRQLKHRDFICNALNFLNE
jgi:hypothetical protein